MILKIFDKNCYENDCSYWLLKYLVLLHVCHFHHHFLLLLLQRSLLNFHIEILVLLVLIDLACMKFWLRKSFCFTKRLCLVTKIDWKPPICDITMGGWPIWNLLHLFSSSDQLALLYAKIEVQTVDRDGKISNGQFNVTR